jgi:hypothetical protein
VFFLEELLAGDAQVAGLYAAVGVDPSFRPPDLGRPVNQSEEEAPELSDGFRRLLRDHYAADDAQLERLLGRALPWARPGAAREPTGPAKETHP